MPSIPKMFKISVIMQVYLGDYSHSRTNSREKFVRAINSFLSQSHPNKELIIVSDGCVFARKIYELIYTSNDKIKFVWIDRNDSRKMYDRKGNELYFRGYPKSVGLTHATGDIITYLDSDDIMLPDHLFTLNSFWTTADDSIKWGSNSLRVLHSKYLDMDLPYEPKYIASYKAVDLSSYGIYEDFFVNACSKYNEISCATYSLSHRKDIGGITWEDSINKTEDTHFVSKLQAKYPDCLRISTPTMVVCHYRNGWDV
jgi:glycosyltransferase involved in cell wall biosynthesis